LDTVPCYQYHPDEKRLFWLFFSSVMNAVTSVKMSHLVKNRLINQHVVGAMNEKKLAYFE